MAVDYGAGVSAGVGLGVSAGGRSARGRLACRRRLRVPIAGLRDHQIRLIRAAGGVKRAELRTHVREAATSVLEPRRSCVWHSGLVVPDAGPLAVGRSASDHRVSAGSAWSASAFADGGVAAVDLLVGGVGGSVGVVGVTVGVGAGVIVGKATSTFDSAGDELRREGSRRTAERAHEE